MTKQEIKEIHETHNRLVGMLEYKGDRRAFKAT